MIYVNYDENTKEINAFYDDEISDYIPKPNFKISQEEHLKALSINANYVSDEFRLIYKEKELSIDLLKEQKLNEVENTFKIAMASLDKTPNEERLTFERQEREAREYLASNDESKAPFLKTLALSRGVDLDDLAQKVVLKADLYANASAMLIGKRQFYEDLITLADTKEKLDFKVEFSL